MADQDTPSGLTGARIAVDVFGGDHAPDAVLDGIVELATTTGATGHQFLLTGPRLRVERGLQAAIQRRRGGDSDPSTIAAAIEFVDAPSIIEMHEHPATAVRAKPDSSLLAACQLVADGRADAMVSAGNSGAVLAASIFAMKRIPGVGRPAIGTAFPSRTGRTFILDVGANTDCRPEWLAQFAVMGAAYASTMMDVSDPRVGLLSNGEESEKGSQLVQAAHPLLAALPLRFVGNIEARDLFTGACDVAVCDGFTGNIVLKAAEGVAEFLFGTIRTIASQSLTGRIGGGLLRSKLRPIRDSVDYRHTGGALLLGVRGEAVIAHGRSDAVAIASALRVAADAVRSDVSGTITRHLAHAAAPPAAEAAAVVAAGTIEEHSQ